MLQAKGRGTDGDDVISKADLRRELRSFATTLSECGCAHVDTQSWLCQLYGPSTSGWWLFHGLSWLEGWDGAHICCRWCSRAPLLVQSKQLRVI